MYELTHKDLEKLLENRFEATKKLLFSKQDEYKMSESPFSAFVEGYCMSFTKSKEEFAWNLLTKHLVSIKKLISLVETHTDTIMVDEKIGDAITYLILIEAMLKEKAINNFRNRGAYETRANKSTDFSENGGIRAEEKASTN